MYMTQKVTCNGIEREQTRNEIIKKKKGWKVDHCLNGGLADKKKKKLTRISIPAHCGIVPVSVKLANKKMWPR